jgi:hypothetical protein
MERIVDMSYGDGPELGSVGLSAVWWEASQEPLHYTFSSVAPSSPYCTGFSDLFSIG